MDKWEIWDNELNDRLSKARASAGRHLIEPVLDSLELYYITRYGKQPMILDEDDVKKFTTITKRIMKYEKEVRSFIEKAFTEALSI